MTISIGIIGGSGVYDPAMLEEIRDEKVDTPWGEVKVKIGRYAGKEVAFMARHGADHSVPPHLVNYRANIMALNQLGVKNIFTTAAVGSLRENMHPGDFVFIDQFLDFTKTRPQTFYEDEVVHLDMTEPYCPRLRGVLKDSAEKAGVPYHNKGTYVCSEGPRFETPAEIKMYEVLGGDVAGMTSVPEVILAREKQMCYATIAIVTNFAAGISDSKVSHQEVLDLMDEKAGVMRKLIMDAIEAVDENAPCRCRDEE